MLVRCFMMCLMTMIERIRIPGSARWLSCSPHSSFYQATMVWFCRTMEPNFVLSSLTELQTTMPTSRTMFASSTTRSLPTMQEMAAVTILIRIVTAKTSRSLPLEKRRCLDWNRKHSTRRYPGRGSWMVHLISSRLSSKQPKVKKLLGCPGNQSDLWLRRKQIQSYKMPKSGDVCSDLERHSGIRPRAFLPSSPNAGS